MYSSSSIPQIVRTCAKYQGSGSTNSSVSQVQYQDTPNNYEVERCQKPGFVFQAGNQLHGPVAAQQSECCTEVVVKYIGTLAMPKTWDHRTQAVSNAVKRMKESRVTHTMVKIKLCLDGIRLYDARGNLLVHHDSRGVAKFGLSSADELLFCLVTHDCKDENSGPSCHIFYTDPQMARHKVHERTAECFGIRCEINIDSDNCVEFPSSAQFAVDLFQKFYVSTLAGSQCNTSNLDIPLFIPPGFETQFNMSGFHNSRDSTDKIVDSVMTDCQNNDASSEIHKWTGVTSYQNHLLKRKLVSGELDKTAVFPVESSSNCSAFKSNSLSSEDDAFESLNVAVNYNDSAYDQMVKDSQNGVENLRKQSQKLLFLNPESGGPSLHVTKFCAYERNGLDPESPLLVLPLRTITNRNQHLDLSSQSTSTPILKQMMTLRSCRADAPAFYAPNKEVIMPDELSFTGSQDSTLLAANSILPDGNVSLISAKVSSASATTQNIDKDLANAADVKMASQEVLCKKTDQKLKSDIAERPNRKNVSFHGSFESVFCDGEPKDSGRSFRPPLGSCREIAAPGVPREIGRVASWAIAFDKLLNDADGVALFKEHLKKEFNEENLQFWLKCEEYKRIPEVQRKDFAAEIYKTHVDPEAQECVNIDQDIANTVKDSLNLAAIDIYEAAQRHIYQLMKQDCYPRFKTSQLFRDAVLAEMEGRPFQLPCGEKDLSLSLIMSTENNPNPKTDSSREDRRMSLLFWQKKKPDIKNKTENGSDEKNGNGLMPSEASRKLSDLKSAIDVKVTTPDGSVTQLRGFHGQKIADVLLKLGTKLNSGLTFVEALNPNTSTVLDVTKDVKTLSCKEILLVDCVVFRLTLPDEKSLAVRCRYKTSVSKCIGPILRKHGFDIDKVVMHITGEGVILKQKMCIDSVNCHHVMVESLTDSIVGRRKRSTPTAVGRLPTEIHKRSTHTELLNSSDSSSSRVQFQLEKLFGDVFHGTVDFSYVAFDELGAFSLEKLSKVRGQQNSRHFTLPSRSLSNKRNGVSEYNKKRSTSSAAEDESFINMLVSAQSKQLNDQRGKLKREDIVLPDFLKEEEPGCANGPPQMKPKPLYHCRTSGHKTDYAVYGVAANNYFVTPSVSSSSCSMSSTDCDNVYSTDTGSEESWNFGYDPHRRNPSRCTGIADLDCQFSGLTDARNELPSVCSLKLLEKQTDRHTGKQDFSSSKANKSPSEQISYQFISSDPKITLSSDSHLCQYKSSYV